MLIILSMKNHFIKMKKNKKTHISALIEWINKTPNEINFCVTRDCISANIPLLKGNIVKMYKKVEYHTDGSPILIYINEKIGLEAFRIGGYGITLKRLKEEYKKHIQ